RRVVAGGVALDVLERELPVRGRLGVADVEVLLEPLADGVAAHHCAQRVGADADEVVADGAALVHRVERRDPADLGSGDAQDVGARLDALGGAPPLGRLHQWEHRQQAGPRLRVAGRDLQQLVVRGGAEAAALGGRARRDLGHLSTPPITGSMLAIATITSATMPPSLITLVAWRLVNDGSRKCARNGLVPPSETTCAPSSPRGDSIGTYTWPGGSRNPSWTSVKWWIRASIDSPMMWRMWSRLLPMPSLPIASWLGHAIFLSPLITRAPPSPATPSGGR